jgi:tRNA threonylcarbamoyladenosine biosynthesis protein TsaE
MEYSLDSDQAMRDFGAHVGEAIKDLQPAKDEAFVLELIGDVGAGKTTFTKGMAIGLGITEDVASPSFTISRVYDAGQKRLYHYDFYRLTDAGILRDELGEVMADPSAIVVIEWADIVEGVLPDDHARLTIRATGEVSRSVIAYGLPDSLKGIA